MATPTKTQYPEVPGAVWQPTPQWMPLRVGSGEDDDLGSLQQPGENYLEWKRRMDWRQEMRQPVAPLPQQPPPQVGSQPLPQVGSQPLMSGALYGTAPLQPGMQLNVPQLSEVQAAAPQNIKMTADQYRMIIQDQSKSAAEKAEAWKGLGITSGGRAVTPGQLGTPEQISAIRASMPQLTPQQLVEQEQRYRVEQRGIGTQPSRSPQAPLTTEQTMQNAYIGARDYLSRYAKGVNMASGLTKEKRERLIQNETSRVTNALNEYKSGLVEEKKQKTILGEAKAERATRVKIAKIGADAQVAIANADTEAERYRSYSAAAQKYIEQDARIKEKQAEIDANSALAQYEGSNALNAKRMDMFAHMLPDLKGNQIAFSKMAMDALTLWNSSSKEDKKLLMGSGFDPRKFAEALAEGGGNDPIISILTNAFMQEMNIKTK